LTSPRTERRVPANLYLFECELARLIFDRDQIGRHGLGGYIDLVVKFPNVKFVDLQVRCFNFHVDIGSLNLPFNQPPLDIEVPEEDGRWGGRE